MSGEAISARRARRKAPVHVGNVVPLRPAPETTEDIERDVEERSRRKEAEIHGMLQAAVATLNVRHRKHAQQCASIGYSMDRPTLDNWIEIGRRMLGQKGRRS